MCVCVCGLLHERSGYATFPPHQVRRGVLRGARRGGGGAGARAIFKATARAIAGVGSDAVLRCAPADTQGSQGSLLHFTAAAAQAEHMQGGIKREELLNECLKD